MKKYLILLVLTISGFVLIINCSDTTEIDIVTPPDVDGITKNVLEGNIMADKTLTAGIWILQGRVFVTSGATLTISPGTIIKAKSGTGTNASVLIIARGGRINAAGTAARPIIFTSESDDIVVGQKTGTNLNETTKGLWGGVIILGNAPIHGDKPTAGATERNIEGLPADIEEGKYGGSNAADNSGTIQYVSVRHGGALIGEGNEINGITFGGVGNGTVVDHIEVVANVDDGVEFFGGTVNVNYLNIWAQGDDGIDIDEAYKGTITNAIVALGINSDHALEVDGPKNDPNNDSQYTISGLTIIGTARDKSGNNINNIPGKASIGDYRDGAVGINANVLVYNFPFEINGTNLEHGSGNYNVELNNTLDNIRFTDGDLVFSNWKIVTLPTVTNVDDIFENDGDSGNTFNKAVAGNSKFASVLSGTNLTFTGNTLLLNINAAAASGVGANGILTHFGWTYYGIKALQ